MNRKELEDLLARTEGLDEAAKSKILHSFDNPPAAPGQGAAAPDTKPMAGF